MMTEITIRVIAIKGKFTEDDWIELLLTLRRIERRHPEELYQACMLDADKDPASDMPGIMERCFPHLPDDEVAGRRPLDEILKEIGL
jgi:hypothetical protein